MAGQLVQRGPDRWLIRAFRGRDAAGKRIYVAKTVAGTRKQAERALRELLGQKDSGTLTKTTRESAETYVTRWLDVWCKGQVRERTLASYRWLLKQYVFPVLGTRKLAQLQPDELRALYQAMAERDLSSRTIRYTHAVIRQALQKAVDLNLLVRNPADLARPPKGVTTERRELNVITPDQTGKFLDAARRDRWYALWLLLLTSGLRPGEALGLKWPDLDGNKVRVVRSLVPGKRGAWALSEPKTERSRRTVALPETTVKALKEHRKRQAEEKLKAGEHYRDHGLIFAMPDGEPPNYRGLVLSHFKPILTRAKLPSTLRVYDLRHSTATLLLVAGEHPKVVSERLGHSSITMTLDTYSHVLPDLQERAAARLEALLSPKPGSASAST
jgi:integrase